jgi:hypothetical protein
MHIYLTFLLPVLLLWAAIRNYRAHQRLLGSGRLVEIHAARTRYALYTTGAAFSFIALLFLIG